MVQLFYDTMNSAKTFYRLVHSYISTDGKEQNDEFSVADIFVPITDDDKPTKLKLYSDRVTLITSLGNSHTIKIQKQDGGSKQKPKHKYKGRAYTVRTGVRGGKYIVVKGSKIYV